MLPSGDAQQGLGCYPRETQIRWLDRPLGAMLRLNGEKALYGLLIALALLSRLWDLGARVFSHDETVHAQWAWYLYRGQGYAHTPLSHGPFLFHANALSFYLFGDNDFSARLVPALLGVLLVALPYTMRRWLGRRGALVTAGLFLISPSMLYYSRYARNDVPILVWTFIFFLALLRYLEAAEDRERVRWLIVLAASLSLMFATKEVAFIYVAILGLGLVGLFFARMGRPHRHTAAWEGWRGVALSVLGLLGVMALAVGLLLFSLHVVGLFPLRYRECGGAPLPGAAGQMTCAEAGCTFIGGSCQRPLPVVVGSAVAEFDATGARVAMRLTGLEVSIALLLIGGVTMLAGWGAHAVLERFMPFRWGERPALDLILAVGSFTLPFLSPLLTSGASRLVSR